MGKIDKKILVVLLGLAFIVLGNEHGANFGEGYEVWGMIVVIYGLLG